MKRYIGAYGVLVRGGNVLLIHKARGPYTGTLDLPGGGLEYGETPEQAVVRELAEETGQAVKVTGVLPPFSLLLEDQHHLGFVFEVALVEQRDLLTDADGQDSAGAVWVSVDGLSATASSPLVRHAFHLA
ncbi:MAG: NUDIX domain-containing protein [Symbiobacteriia bacterium]